MQKPKQLILAIESSGKICSVSLIAYAPEICNVEIISEYNIYEGNKHDKYLAELCRRILADNGLEVNQLIAVAVSIGPGSFTGLRIGTAVAKALCFSLTNDDDVKLLAVPTLNTLSFNVINSLKPLSIYVNSPDDINNNFQVLSIIFSHNDFVYYQLFDNNNQPLTEIIFSDIQRIKAQYSERKNLFITTNSKLNIDFGVYLPQFSQISASMVGVLSTVMYSRHEFADSNELVPLYVQDFVPINHTK